MTTEEAIEILSDVGDINRCCAEDAEALDMAIKALKKRPTGKWITTRTLMHDGEFYCNQCKCDSPNNEKWDYCPNCGARMGESEEEDER